MTNLVLVSHIETTLGYTSTNPPENKRTRNPVAAMGWHTTHANKKRVRLTLSPWMP